MAAPRCAACCAAFLHALPRGAVPLFADEQAYDISLQKLQKLLEERTKYYDNADVQIDLRGYGKDEQSGAPTPVVMHRLLQAVHEKIQSTQQERESRRQFTIERAGDVPSMRKEPAKGPQAAAEE